MSSVFTLVPGSVTFSPFTVTFPDFTISPASRRLQTPQWAMNLFKGIWSPEAEAEGMADLGTTGEFAGLEAFGLNTGLSAANFSKGF